METIKDIRRDNVGTTTDAVSKIPLPIQSQFGTPSVLKFVSLGIGLAGIALAVIGIVMFIIPLTVTGVIVLLVGGGIYWGRGVRTLAEVTPTPEPSAR